MPRAKACAHLFHREEALPRIDRRVDVGGATALLAMVEQVSTTEELADPMCTADAEYYRLAGNPIGSLIVAFPRGFLV